MPEASTPSPGRAPADAQSDASVNRFLLVLVCLLGFVLGFVPACFVVGAHTLRLFAIISIPLIVVVIVTIARERVSTPSPPHGRDWMLGTAAATFVPAGAAVFFVVLHIGFGWAGWILSRTIWLAGSAARLRERCAPQRVCDSAVRGWRARGILPQHGPAVVSGSRGRRVGLYDDAPTACQPVAGSRRRPRARALAPGLRCDRSRRAPNRCDCVPRRDPDRRRTALRARSDREACRGRRCDGVVGAHPDARRIHGRTLAEDRSGRARSPAGRSRDVRPCARRSAIGTPWMWYPRRQAGRCHGQRASACS